MKIGEAAKCTGLSISNIRFYEKKKLLDPKRDDENQYRDYTPEDIERLKKIVIFRKLDIPIETIQAIFNKQMSIKAALENQEEELSISCFIRRFTGCSGYSGVQSLSVGLAVLSVIGGIEMVKGSIRDA